MSSSISDIGKYFLLGYKNLQHLGVDISLDRMDQGRVKLLNNLNLLSIEFCVVLTFILIWQGLIIQPILVSSGAIVFSIPLLLNHRHLYEWARWLFILVGSSLIIAVSLFAYPQGLFTDTENILFAFMAVNMFLFGGIKRHLIYWGLFCVIILLKYVRLSYMGMDLDMRFVLLIQNTLILGSLLYLFMIYFSNSLKNLTREVIEHEQNIYSLIDNISLFIALIDTSGRFKIVNKQYERAFGIPRNEIIGKLPDEVLPKYLADGQLRVVKEALRTKDRVEFKESKELEDGTINVGHGYVTPIIDEKGEVVAVAGFVNNITQLEAAKRELANANKTKDRLFSIVAHDIKSPLALFESILNASQDQLLSKAEFDVFIKKLQGKFQPIRQTIDDLLIWSKSNLDAISAKKEVFDPCMVIREIAEYHQLLATEKKIKLSLEGQCNDAFMDRDHFKIIARNLIQNALKFTHINGRITIEMKNFDNHCEVIFTDSGVGMSHEVLKKIVTGTIQTSSAGTGGESGTGIGLSLVMELVKKNDCEIRIHSNVGEGTTISVSIPKQPATI